MSDIKICPFRTYTEVRPAILQGQGDVTLMGFMDCLKNKCPAFYVRDGEEHCNRLAQPEHKTGWWELAEDGWYCSACELYPPFDCDPEEKGIPYCPWCGAKMEVEHDTDR